MTSNAPSAEARIEVLLGKYTPEIAAQLSSARARLRARFPRGHELVYDNYNALVFAISPSGRTSDAFVSIAGYPRWVTLFFLHGTQLADPLGVLEGQGKQVRSIRLNGPADIDAPAVVELIAQATLAYRSLLAAAPPLTTTIQSISDKQRPRRPVTKSNVGK